MKSNISKLITAELKSMPGGKVRKVLEKYQGKKLNLEDAKIFLTEMAADLLYNGKEEKVKQKDIIDVYESCINNSVFDAMGIKVPSTHIKYANQKENELIFNNEDEAIQYLADITQKQVKVASSKK